MKTRRTRALYSDPMRPTPHSTGWLKFLAPSADEILYWLDKARQSHTGSLMSPTDQSHAAHQAKHWKQCQCFVRDDARRPVAFDARPLYGGRVRAHLTVKYRSRQVVQVPTERGIVKVDHSGSLGIEQDVARMQIRVNHAVDCWVPTVPK